jgi:hypothetical protein
MFPKTFQAEKVMSILNDLGCTTQTCSIQGRKAWHQAAYQRLALTDMVSDSQKSRL